MPVDRKVRQKAFDRCPPEIAPVPPLVEADEPANPLDVCSFCAMAVVTRPDPVSNHVEQSRGWNEVHKFRRDMRPCVGIETRAWQ